MKKLTLGFVLATLLGGETQALRLENNSGDEVTFVAVTPQMASVYQDEETIKARMFPGTADISILDLLKSTREKLQQLGPEREKYLQFEVQIGLKGPSKKCAVYLGPETVNQGELYPNELTDPQLENLDDNYKLEVLRDGTCAFRMK